jgi:Mrp family chromosome partitioning ATPase/capsular polysaccharide biosynthesis protein
VNPAESARRHWILIATVACIFLCGGIAAGVVRHPVYSAEASAFVQVSADQASALANATEASNALAVNYSRAIVAQGVIDSASRASGLSAGAIAGNLTAAPVPDSPVIRVLATGSSARSAVATANAGADALARYVTTLNSSQRLARTVLARYEQALSRLNAALARQRANTSSGLLGNTAAVTNRDAQAVDAARVARDALRARYSTVIGMPVPHLVLLASAHSASSDRRSKLALAGIAGLFIGLVVGLALAVLRDALGGRMPTRELQHIDGLPLLGELGRLRRAKSGLAVLVDPSGREADAVRLLRTVVDAKMGRRGVIAVSGVVQTEEKSVLTANLALAFAEAGRSVALVDVDLSSSRQASLLKVTPRAGTAKILAGDASVQNAQMTLEVVRPGHSARFGRFDFIAGRTGIDQGAALGAHDEMLSLLSGLRSTHDVVVLDAAAVGGNPQVSSIASLVDVLLVVSLENPRRSRIARAAVACRKLTSAAPGLVVVGRRRRASKPHDGGATLSVVDLGRRTQGSRGADRREDRLPSGGAEMPYRRPRRFFGFGQPDARFEDVGGDADTESL